MTFISLAFFSCFRKNAKDPDEKSGLPPFSVAPFLKSSLSEARKIAAEHNRQVLLMIIEPEMDPEKISTAIGLANKKEDQSFFREYVPLYLTTDNPEAESLIDSLYIQAFPAVITYYKGNSTPSRLQYGRPWPGREAYLTPDLMAPLFQSYQEGDKDIRLVRQLLDHFLYLPLNDQNRQQWKLQLKNDYLSSFSLEGLQSMSSYKMLQSEVSDIRLEILDTIFKYRKELNDAYEKIAANSGTRRKMSADWIILRAIRRSYELACEELNEELFLQAERVKEKYEKGYMDEWIAKSIFLYHLKNKENELAKAAALQYFQTKKNWSTSREYTLMEAGARLVVAHSQKTAEWIEAERWIRKAVEGRVTPTRLELQIKIFNRLDEKEKALAAQERLDSYQASFDAFLDFYPIQSGSIELDRQKVKKKALKKIPAIPKAYRQFYEYISLEGSLFKKGELVEPIALLSKNEKEVVLLSRVHLVTTSLLPVTHIKSYYVETTFSRQGGYLGSQYR